MTQNPKFPNIVCSSATNKIRAVLCSALALSLSGAVAWPLAICQSGAALAQSTSADGQRVGPALDDVRRKRQEDQEKALEKMNTPASPGQVGAGRHVPSLTDMFPAVSLGLLSPQPISLEGVKIPGLTQRSVDALANNQMAVIYGNGFNYPSMSDLYRENRIMGRSNFVSADVLTHLYYVFTNSIFIKVVENTLYPEMQTLLKDLAESCVHDYRACDIAEVKDDIQRNLAFVIVGLRLLDPKGELPDMGGATDLAKTELAAIVKGGHGRSVIFNRDQDFNSFRPIGFFGDSAKAARFYRACSWLSAMYFPLTDVTNNSETGGGNTFRRAVLLYRALELGKARDNATLLSHWQRIVEIYALVSQGRLTREPSVYPRDLRSMFSSAGKLDFKDLLYSLAQPLSRARLLISIKNQRQLGLNAVSIFEIDKQKEAENVALVFRFLPPLMPYEIDWLRYTVKDFRDEGSAGAASSSGANSNSNFANPLSLYILYAWGAGQASNVLRAFADRLDPTLYFGLGELVRTEGKRQRQTDPNSSFQYPERRWTLISDYFVPVKKGSQSILYSDSWMTQRLNSASGAFVDSFIAIDKSYKTALAPAKQLSGSIAPGGKTTTATVDNKGEAVAAAAVAGLRAAGANAPAGAGSDASAPVKAPEPPPVRGNKVPIFHYLEPVPDYYRHLSTFVLNYENELIRLNAFPEDQRSKLSDFRRLLDRMVKICDKEINLEPLPSADFHLLANFDQVLSAVDSPLAGSIYVPGVNGGGASLGLGNAGACYVIFNTDKGPYLSRGAVYSYFEVAGGPFKMEHWERKRAFGFLRPLSWLSQFDLMQENSDSVKEDKDKKDTKDFKDSKNSKDKSDARTNKGSASPNSNFNTPGPLPTLKVK